MPKQQYKEDTDGRESLKASLGKANINHRLIINLRDISHTMRSLYEGKASQKRILIILNEVTDITQRELTARLGIQPGSASEILSKLENAGLILRRANEADRRTVDISLTDTGKQMAIEAAKQRSLRHMEMFSCLSEREKEELLSLLEKINKDWDCRYGTGEVRRSKRHQDECAGGHGRRHQERED